MHSNAVALRALIALDLKFMVSCDCNWTIYHGEAPAPAAAGVDCNVLPPAAATDDDAAPAVAPGSPQVDPRDFTKWNVLELAMIPMAVQNFASDNFIGHHSAHAALILFYLSDRLRRYEACTSRLQRSPTFSTLDSKSTFSSQLTCLLCAATHL